MVTYQVTPWCAWEEEERGVRVRVRDEVRKEDCQIDFLTSYSASVRRGKSVVMGRGTGGARRCPPKFFFSKMSRYDPWGAGNSSKWKFFFPDPNPH
jgi:hypothetical protein